MFDVMCCPSVSLGVCVGSGHSYKKLDITFGHIG